MHIHSQLTSTLQCKKSIAAKHAISKLPPSPIQCLIPSKDFEQYVFQKTPTLNKLPLTSALLDSDTQLPKTYTDPVLHKILIHIGLFENAMKKETVGFQVCKSSQQRDLMCSLIYRKIELIDYIEHCIYEWLTLNPVHSTRDVQPVVPVLLGMLEELKQIHENLVQDLIEFELNPWLADKDQMNEEELYQANLLWKMLSRFDQGIHYQSVLTEDETFLRILNHQARINAMAMFARLISRKSGRYLLRQLAWRKNNRSVVIAMDEDPTRSIHTDKHPIKDPKKPAKELYQATTFMPAVTYDTSHAVKDSSWDPNELFKRDKHLTRSDSASEWDEITPDQIPSEQEMNLEGNVCLSPAFIHFARELAKAIRINAANYAFTMPLSAYCDMPWIKPWRSREDAIITEEVENPIRREHKLPPRWCADIISSPPWKD